MTLSLNIYRVPGSGFTQIYVNGLPISEKVWLQPSRGRTTVRFKGGVEVMPTTEVLALIEEAMECDPLNWNELLAAVEAAPKESRGRKAGVMAANRRGFAVEPPPTGWTEDHADDLDPNFRSHPLSVPATIIVDDREPAEMVDRLRGVTNLMVEIDSMETGDYVVPGKVMIERKTIQDFANSIEDKRMFLQIDRLTKSGHRPVLLIEGDIYTQTRLSLESISGFMSYLVSVAGVFPIRTLSLSHTAYMITKLVRHSVQGLGYEHNLRELTPQDPAKRGAFVLEGVPGVSTKVAKVLIQNFGSVAGVCRATQADLLAVPGIGPITAKRVLETLHSS